MINISLIPRMEAVRQVAMFSVTDMATWFGVKRATMSAWLNNYSSPRGALGRQLLPHLMLLEKATADKRFFDRIPVPLSVGLYERKSYIEKLKADAITLLSKNGVAGAGAQVSGTDKSKQAHTTRIF